MSARRHDTVETLRQAARRNDLSVIEGLLADDVTWYGNWPGGGCRNREQVLDTLRGQLEQGVRLRLGELRAEGDRVLLSVRLSVEGRPTEPESTIWFALTLDRVGRIIELQDYSTAAAAEHDMAVRASGLGSVGGGTADPSSHVTQPVPFARVADLGRSVAFYRLLGLEVSETHEHEGRVVWAFLSNESAGLMLAHEGESIDARAQGVLFYLYARDLIGLRDHLVAHGLTPGEIVDGTPGPKREMRVTDPDGYDLMVAQIDEETIIR
jgi:SnoaL-like domain/Glyoxalase/Bleomycin resistance protein/Dioxygenase superfamily